MSRLQAWMNERDALAGELRNLADSLFDVQSPRQSGPPQELGPRHEMSMRAAGTSSAGKAKKRTMSPEARAKIAAAQKARWAKQRGEGGSAKKAKKS
jgi:hypothetical protein